MVVWPYRTVWMCPLQVIRYDYYVGMYWLYHIHYYFRYVFLVYGMRFPMGLTTCHAPNGMVIFVGYWHVDARDLVWLSRSHCYEHPPRRKVLYGDSSTLTISQVSLRARDRPCDIHVGFCSSSLVNSIYWFPFVDSVEFLPSLPRTWLVKTCPFGTPIELAKPPK